VGESTTSAVVISLVMIFVADFVLSFLFFQGQGDALKQLKVRGGWRWRRCVGTCGCACARASAAHADTKAAGTTAL
jgi:hypothetical protein